MSNLESPESLETLEMLLARQKTETGDTRFSRETARLAGVKSGASRRPMEKEKDARRAYSYVCQTADLIAARLHTGTTQCPHCKRGGPIDPRLLQTLSTTLSNLCETILAYAWGRPSQESKAKREGSIEEYKAALREVVSEENESYIPAELLTDDTKPIPEE
jgi:hypothetical protein